MKNFHRIRRALLLISLSAVGSTSVQAFFRSGSLFEPFNDLLEEFDAVNRPTKSKVNAEKDLQSHAKTLQEEAKKLSKAADELVAGLEAKKNEPDFAKSFEKVSDSHIAVDEAMMNIRREFKAVRRAQYVEAAKKAPVYNLKTNVDSSSGNFVVTARLPEIAKEDLKITVKTTEEFGVERQTLHVSAAPKTTKSDTAVATFSSSTSQARYINGRREELIVEDGAVTIVVDLPRDASNDLAAVQKTMKLDGGVLTLAFPLTKKESQKETELRFSPGPVAQQEAATREIKIK